MVPKFRAWEPDTKFMNDQVRVTSNRFGDGEILVEATDGFGWIEVKPEYLMQSTGLKDKNGVEIFEGDIVAIKYSESGYHYYEKIVFENGTFTAGDEDWLYNIKDYCVVCGNIYENPELLEPANENQPLNHHNTVDDRRSELAILYNIQPTTANRKARTTAET